jgi:hypothetical protein
MKFQETSNECTNSTSVHVEKLVMFGNQNLIKKIINNNIIH